MKTKITMILLAMGALLAFSAGCGKSENTAPPAVQDTQPATDAATAADAVEAEAQEQQAAADKVATADKLAAERAAAENAAAEKLAQAAAMAAQEQGRIQTLIDTAKDLTGQNKYAEAMKVIDELSKLTLSPEQQSLVDSLKQTAEEQAAKAVADKAAAGATKALGDALGGKKP